MHILTFRAIFIFSLQKLHFPSGKVFPPPPLRGMSAKNVIFFGFPKNTATTLYSYSKTKCLITHLCDALTYVFCPNVFVTPELSKLRYLTKTSLRLQRFTNCTIPIFLTNNWNFSQLNLSSMKAQIYQLVHKSELQSVI